MACSLYWLQMLRVQFNRVFAGRNWNSGETVEIVLRRPNGTFYKVEDLIDTLCHELAHIAVSC